MTTPEREPASRLLTAELSRKVRERGIVVWLDAERKYSELASTLRDRFEFRYPVVSHQGSYLELVLALREFGNGLQPEHVLVHLPGLNKETIKETPVLELYKAGTVFEKNLETLVREAAVGVARPEEVETFLRDAPALTLEATDAWLEGLRAAPRDQLTVYLEAVGIEDVVLDAVAQRPRLAQHLQRGGEQLLAYLEKQLGLSRAWRQFVIPGGELNPHNTALLVGSWLMAVES